IPGASLGTALLRFDGQPTNRQAGVVIRTLVAAVLVFRRTGGANRKDSPNLRFRQRRSPGSGTGSAAADPGGERAPLHAGVCEPDDPRRTPRLLQLGLRRHRDSRAEPALLSLPWRLRRQFGARRADRLWQVPRD